MSASTSFTLQRKALEALEDAGRTFRAIVDKAHAAVLILDDRGRLVYVNPQFCRMLERPAAELIGRSLDESLEQIFDAEAIAMLRERSLRHTPGVSAPSRFTIRTRYRGAKSRWFEVCSAAIQCAQGDQRIVAQLQDTTVEVKAKRKLVEREERYRALIESAPVGILSVDRHGRIQELNKKMLEILGSPSQEATKAINVLTFPLLVRSGITANFQHCFRTGESRVLESLYTSHWGRKALLRYHLSPLKREQDRIISVQAIVEDISEQKRLERGITDAQEREALGILGGGIAHEFNNLLQVIQGYAEILAYDSRLPPRRSEAVLEIKHASQRAAELTRRLLNQMNREPLPSLPLEKNKTILLADNELILRRLGVEFLSNFGYTVLSVGDCKEALAVFREHQAQIDLVILDLVIPELGGEWCMEEMLQLKPEQKVLVASDYSLCTTVGELLRLGACAFITKPYRLLELLATVREVLGIAAQG